jgi:hypothetical protein
MYGITIEFVRFDDIKFGEILRATGVYVIWDSQARAKPSYIGKGDILSRLSSHDGNFAFPVKGYVALVGNRGQKNEDNDALIVEALLLKVAFETDRWPTHNKKSGSIALLKRVYDKHGVIRVTLNGCDPFGPPHAPRALDEPKQIWFELDNDGAEAVTHHWNFRKRAVR